MKCIETKGTGLCAYNIMLPYYVRFCGNSPIKPKTKYVTVDKCLVHEIIELWERGIKTTGCCCGHGKQDKAFISIRKEFSNKMLELGYELFPNGDKDHFRPQTHLKFGKINKGFNWWSEDAESLFEEGQSLNVK